MLTVMNNILAMNAERQLKIVGKNKSKNTEKLAFGYRINRAADDAAGLAISEKMRRQIRGLTQGVENCQDGISMCQVADGAMAEVHDMIQRINELCVQAANGTNTDSDREAIDQEIQQIKKELDRIGNETTFNEIKVLQGTTGKIINGKKYVPFIETVISKETVKQIIEEEKTMIRSVWGGENAYVKEYFGMESDKLYKYNVQTLYGFDSAILAYTVDFSKVNSAEAWKNLDGASISFSCPLADTTNFEGLNVATFKFDNSISGIYDLNPEVNVQDGDDCRPKTYLIGTKDYINGADFISEISEFVKNMNVGISGSIQAGYITMYDVDRVGHQMYLNASGNTLQVRYGISIYPTIPDQTADAKNKGKVMATSAGWEEYTDIVKVEKDVEIEVEKEIKVWKWVDADEDEEEIDIQIQYGVENDHNMWIRLPHIDCEALEMTEVAGNPAEKALESLTILKNALQKVSEERSRMGAYTNGLEHLVVAESNTVENTTAAESVIRDYDMAKGMVEYSNHSILEQVGTAMIAQANHINENILKLLQ